MKSINLKLTYVLQGLLLTLLAFVVVALGFWTYTFDDNSSLTRKIETQKQFISQRLASARESVARILVPTPTIVAEPIDPTPTPTPAVLLPTPTPIKTPEVYLPINFYFNKNKSLYYYYSDTNSYQEIKVSSESLPVTSFDFVDGQNLFAYVVNPDPLSDQYLNDEKISEVYVGKGNPLVESLSIEKIYSLEFKYEPSWDYASMVSDVKFSPDGKKLAITTHDAIWMYDVEKKSLVNTINTPEDQNIIPKNLYGYINPRYSPDGKKLLVSKSYWGRSSDILIDLVTNKVHDFKNVSGEGGGSYYVDWSDSDNLVGIEGDRGGERRIVHFNIYDSSKKIINILEYGDDYEGMAKNIIFLSETINSKRVYSTLDLIDKRTTVLSFLISGSFRDISGRDGKKYLLFLETTPTSNTGIYITDQNPDSASKRWLLEDDVSFMLW